MERIRRPVSAPFGRLLQSLTGAPARLRHQKAPKAASLSSPVRVQAPEEAAHTAELRLWDVQAYIERQRDIILVPQDFSGTTEPYTIISHTWAQDLRDFTRMLVAKGASSSSEVSSDSYPAVIRRGQLVLSREVSIEQGVVTLLDASLELTQEECSTLAHTIEILDIIARLVRGVEGGCRYAWVDFLCLNQADESDIRAAIPHMAAWYRMAAQCHAYPLGFDLDVSMHSMKMFIPRWYSRAWTLQEYILSQSVIFVYLFKESEFATVDAVFGKDGTPGRTTFNNRITGRSIVACLEADTEYSFNLSTNMADRKPGEKEETAWDTLPIGIKLLGNRRSLYSLRMNILKPCASCHAAGVQTAIRDCSKHADASVCHTVMSMMAHREAAREEDLIYSVCGILRPRSFEAVYRESIVAPGMRFKEARDAVLCQLSAPGLIGIISSNWCGPSALPPLIDARPTSGFELRSMNADASFDAVMGMRVTGKVELFRVWDTPHAPPGITKEEWDANPLVLHFWGCGSETQLCPTLLHGVSLDDHPEITSEAEVKAEDVKSVFAGFQAGQVEGLDVTMLELGVCTHSMFLKEDSFAILAMAVSNIGSEQQFYHGLALILEASQLNEGEKVSCIFR